MVPELLSLILGELDRRPGQAERAVERTNDFLAHLTRPYKIVDAF